MRAAPRSFQRRATGDRNRPIETELARGHSNDSANPRSGCQRPLKCRGIIRFAVSNCTEIKNVEFSVF